MRIDLIKFVVGAFIVALLMQFATSCTKEESCGDFAIKNEKMAVNDLAEGDVKVNLYDFDSDRELDIFRAYNDSLSFLNEKNTTSNLLRVTPNEIRYLSIPLADAKGAYEGWKRGKGFFSRLIGAVVGAVGYSAVVAIQCLIEFPVEPKSCYMDETPHYVYAQLIKTNQYEAQLSIWKENIGLCLDEKYEALERVGGFHNATLDVNNVTTQSTWTNYFDSETVAVLCSSDFNGFLKKPRQYYEGTITESPFAIQYTQSRADGIMKLYSEAYMSKMESTFFNQQSVNLLVKDYISMTEKTGSLTSEERNQIISTLIVSSYSFGYWKSKKSN